MSEFFAMGGYAEFVWGSFGFTALVMVFNVVSARRQLRNSLRRVSERAARRRVSSTRSASTEEVTEQ
jgi:heme exporter protein D